MITRFEHARVLGARSLQLAMGAPALVKVPRTVNVEDPMSVAKYEIQKKAVPISIVRIHPDGHREVVEVR
ncbi:MAG TPA: DNA-directed RNA polymerase subunit K [archaeon]|nr:DNA-directed RNA polymerase subunit K [archaeon]